jgi:PAS domain S-box-containing protein
MQTLQIDFESVFEALPGMHLLLNTDSPRFTIASISSEYSAKVCLSKEEATGRSVFDLHLECEFNWDTSLKESLETVIHTCLPHSFHYTIKQEDFSKTYHISNHPVLSQQGDRQVSFIIHKLAMITDLFFEVPKQSLEKTGEVSLESLIEQAPVAMCYVHGERFVLKEANNRMLELWGKSKEILGKPLLEGIPELIDQPFPDLMRNVFTYGKEHAGTETKAYLNRTGKLEEFYFNFIYAPVRNLQGQLTGIMMIASEVTGLVLAKKALEESEKRYRDLIAQATVATAVYVGSDMIIHLANEAMLRLWGKDQSVIGKPLREAIPELDGQPFHVLLDTVFKTGHTYHSKEDKADLKVNGRLHTFYFNFTYKALYDTEGNIYGILNMAVDVSDIVRTKMAIHEAEERWRLALQSAELGTWDYFPDSKIFICSAKTKALFGMEEDDESRFETMLNAIHPQDRERVAKEIRKSLQIEGGATYRVEYSVVRLNDKKLRWHRTSGQAFYKENGDAYRLTGTILDITDRKEIETALEERVSERTAELIAANRELERSNHELEQYAYVASHDLQEPLRKILVYSDLLKNNVPTQTAVTNEDRLGKIISSAQRMSYLIQDLLNFSKLLKTETVFQPVDLNQILKNVTDDFELMINETNANVSIDSLPTIQASSQQMNQLFYNLISNALKFRKENGRPNVQIGARRMTDKEVQNFGELNPSLVYFDIHVSDNGIGFDKRYSNQIFEIFKRLNTRSKFEGTGIGLAVCRKIAVKHQGLIHSESVEEQGSIFHVLLPETQLPQ